MRGTTQQGAGGGGRGTSGVGRHPWRLALVAVGALLAACDVIGDPSAPRLRDRLAAAPVRMSARAQVGATTVATQVLVGAFYLTRAVPVSSLEDFDDLEDVDGGFLGAKLADLATARGQQVPVSVDLTPCLADERVVRSGGTCPVYVTALLLRGQNAYDPRDAEAIFDMDENVMDVAVLGPFTVAPGATLTVPQPLTLDEVQEVRAAPAVLSLVVGQSAALQASVLNAFAEPVPGRIVTWSSENPLVARVDAGGVVTGVSAGSTTVRAASGGYEARVPVSVAAPRLVLPFDTVATFGVARGVVPTLSAPVGIISSVSAIPIDLAGLQVTYGPGASGWLTPTLTGSRTPATLLLTLGNTAALAPGQYTAAVTIVPTNPSVARRTMLVSLTVTGVASVDCSRSQVAPYFPPSTAQRIAPAAPWYTGSTGQFFLAYNLGTAAQPVTVQWDMYGVPDAITICFRGRAVYDSGVPVSGAGQFVLPYPGATGLDPRDPTQSIYLYLSVRAEDSGTSWQVRVLGSYVAPSYTVPGPFALRTPAEIARLLAADRASAAAVP